MCCTNNIYLYIDILQKKNVQKKSQLTVAESKTIWEKMYKKKRLTINRQY